MNTEPAETEIKSSKEKHRYHFKLIIGITNGGAIPFPLPVTWQGALITLTILGSAILPYVFIPSLSERLGDLNFAVFIGCFLTYLIFAGIYCAPNDPYEEREEKKSERDKYLN